MLGSVLGLAGGSGFHLPGSGSAGDGAGPTRVRVCAGVPGDWRWGVSPSMWKVTLMGGPLTVAGGEVKVSPERVMGEVTIAPRRIVRVPPGRKSHQEPMPPLEVCSATQWPTGVSAGRVSVCAEIRSTGRSKVQRNVARMRV